PDVDPEVEVEYRAQQHGDRVENDNGVGERGGLNRAEAAKERTRLGGRRGTYGQRLMGNRAEQCDSDQTMNNHKHCCHESRSGGTVRQVYVNNSTAANGSADQGRKRLRVNLVFWPDTTSTRT